MAFSNIEYQAFYYEVDRFVESVRPPKHIRNEHDIVYTISGQTIDIGELRPKGQGLPGDKIFRPLARIKYVRKEDAWSIYWMRRDMKWQLHDVKLSLTDALKTIKVDHDGCFFG